jgi:tetratricopeptide (TPR) repeat protein
MRLRLAELWLCIFCLLVAGGASAKKPSATERVKRQFDSISILLEKADKKRESGDLDDAQQLYGATIAAYQDFNRKFPGANGEIVKFRIAYCRNQLINLLAVGRAADIRKEMQEREKAAPKLTPEEAQVIGDNIELCRTGDYKKVFSNIRKFIKKHPDCSQAYLLLGTAAIGNGKVKDAVAFLNKAVEIDPENRDAHYNLCQLLIRAERPDFDAARIHYNKAVMLGASPDADLKSVLDL